MRLLALLLCVVVIPAWAKPLIVTTIRPLAMIAGEVAGDAADVRQLLPDTETEHHYSLRISDRQLLATADLVIWIGPGLENFLAKSLSSRKSDSVITAATLASIAWPSQDARLTDNHIWLNPDNATEIARAISLWLIAKLPSAGAEVSTNFATFATAQQAAADSIRSRLGEQTNKSLVVDHDAFGHFFYFFNLHQVGALRGPGGLPVGARELNRILALPKVGCVVAEPRHRSDRVRRIANQLGANVAVIDPLGVSGRVSNKSYADFMREIGVQIADCLQSPPA